MFSGIGGRVLRLVATGGAGTLLGVSGFAAGTTVLPLAAATPSPATSAPAKPPAYCDEFVRHLAKDLGKKESELRAALKQAASETIDDAVRSGDLSQQQGEKLRTRIDKSPYCLDHLSGLRHHKDRLQHFMAAYRLAAAKALGITSGELQADLAKGLTLHAIADTQKITEAQFRASMVKYLTPRLDRLVQKGKLTPEQEAQILERLQQGELPLWDHTFTRTWAPDLT